MVIRVTIVGLMGILWLLVQEYFINLISAKEAHPARIGQ